LFATATSAAPAFRAIAGTDLPGSLNSLSGLTETNGGIPYGTGDNAYAWLGAGAAGAFLMGNGAAAPSFLTAGASGYMLVGTTTSTAPAWTASTGTGSPVRSVDPALTGAVDIGGATSLKIPNWATTGTLDAAGKIAISQNNMAISSYINDAEAEIAGEASISFMQHFSICFDPKSVYDQTTTHILFLMTIGKEAPNGILIHKASLSFQADPTTEFDGDLYHADAFIGLANEHSMLALNTTAGAFSQDTDANIHAGAKIDTAKVLYIKIHAEPLDTANLCIFEFWYTIEED
jgi:hypothetical protein